LLVAAKFLAKGLGSHATTCKHRHEHISLIAHIIVEDNLKLLSMIQLEGLWTLKTRVEVADYLVLYVFHMLLGKQSGRGPYLLDIQMRFKPPVALDKINEFVLVFVLRKAVHEEIIDALDRKELVLSAKILI
jgi:hypothetical protein